MENPKEMLGPKGLIKKNELMKIIIQCLHSLRYKKSVGCLEKESSISWRSEEFIMLESHIRKLNWDSCIESLENFHDVTNDTRTLALVAVFEQYLYECLKGSDFTLSLNVLQKKIATSMIGEENIHKLARYLIVESNERSVLDLQEILISKLEEILLGIPQKRLEYVVESFVDQQIVHCLHHNSSNKSTDISLYRDHNCLEDHIPTKTIQILTDHEDEVSLVQFSNSGRYLASSSGCTLIVWEVQDDNKVIIKFKEKSLKTPISKLAWSPDDTMLLTFANNIYLWDIESGVWTHTLLNRNRTYSNCAWSYDSKSLIYVSDTKGVISQWDLINGNAVHEIRRLDVGNLMPKVLDIALTPDVKKLIALFSDKSIWIWKVSKNSEGIINILSDHVISENQCITSLSISRDSQLLIVNVDCKEIHMWDVDNCHESGPIIFHGCVGRLIQSCFGGLNSMFIASGSEDSKVYIWNYPILKPLKVLSGHKKTVNCVSWSPERLQMLASASNDGTIRIWGPSRSN